MNNCTKFDVAGKTHCFVVFFVIPGVICVPISQWMQRCTNKGANLRKSAMKTLAMIKQLFQKQSMSHMCVFECYARFRVAVQPLKVISILKVHQLNIVAIIHHLVCGNRCRTIQDLANEAGIGYGTCQPILTQDPLCWAQGTVCCSLLYLMTPSSYWWWWELDLWLGPWDEATVFPVKEPKVSDCKRCDKWRVKSRAFLFSLMPRGFWAKNSSHKTIQSISHPVMFFSDSEQVQKQWPKICEQWNWLLYPDNVPCHSSLFTNTFLIKNNMIIVIIFINQ